MPEAAVTSAAVTSAAASEEGTSAAGASAVATSAAEAAEATEDGPPSAGPAFIASRIPRSGTDDAMNPGSVSGRWLSAPAGRSLRLRIRDLAGVGIGVVDHAPPVLLLCADHDLLVGLSGVRAMLRRPLLGLGLPVGIAHRALAGRRGA
jgi:hypothetical protein